MRLLPETGFFDDTPVGSRIRIPHEEEAESVIGNGESLIGRGAAA